MSDLHGCYNKYVKMLEKIGFSDEDTLYILGDIVDRGSDGIKLLLDAMGRKNVVALLGNHDFLCSHLLKAIADSPEIQKNELFLKKYDLWLMDGGAPTVEGFLKLAESEQKKILLYMSYMPVYEELEVGGRRFFLSHTVPEKSRMLKFKSLMWQEFIIGEPEYETEYFDDKIIVTGHTPTGFISPKYKGRIWQKNNHIAIDCGAVFGNPLGCICLDTLEEFYVEE